MRKYCIIILYFLPLLCCSQGEFNKWYFGVNAGIDFNSTPPVGLTGSAMNTMYASVSVADSLGNLLFYSQGLSVYNHNHQVMPNGSGLLGDQETQGVFAVKKPGSDNLYFIFTIFTNIMPINYGLYYSLIDMNLNGGLGDVVAGYKNILVTEGEDVVNGIYGTRHLNNKDAWIVVRKTVTNKYASYHITSSGISTTPVLSSCTLASCGFPSCGYVELKISQDGTRYIFLSNDPVQNIYLAELGNFNSQTGVLTPLFQFCPVNLVSLNPQNFEFSPDSKLLYVASSFTVYNRLLFQYDLNLTDSAAFMQSQLLISSTHQGESLQLGPDGKIYQCVGGFDSLNVINNPNVRGLGCNFQSNAMALASGTHNHGGLPQFLQRYKAYLHSTGSDCQVDSMHFSGDIWPPADTIRWNFGDPASGGSNISYLATPAHHFSSPGNYMVELYVRHNDNRTDTTWRSIIIYPSPAPSLSSDKTVCTGNSVTFDAGFCTGCSYEWKNVVTGLVVGTNQTFTTGIAGNYCVSVTNGSSCSGYDTVQLITTAVPQITNTQLTKSICSGESTNIPLTSDVTGTNFHWTASLTSGLVTGFSADSGLVINQTLLNSGNVPGSVTYHVIPKIGDCAGNHVNFLVTVTPGDSVKITITSPVNSVCAGTPVTFTATSINGGIAPIYQWKVNGVTAGANSPTYSYIPVTGDVVTCALTSSNTVCTSNNPATSNPITMVVNQNLPVSISLSPSSNSVCAGTAITFTTIPVHGGTSPSYQWFVNGTLVGTNTSVYTFIPNNGDLVSCTMTSSETCVSGNPASSIQYPVSVSPVLPVSITITASNNPVCAGTPVTFTASPINGGITPIYQWIVNATNAGINSSTFTYTPSNGDLVSCTMTSSETCVSGNPASSIQYLVSVSQPPIVTFTPCFDTITTDNANPFKLKGGLPLGGTYSGPGVTPATSIFTPSAAGLGSKIITYSYTNAGLCSKSAFATIVTRHSLPVTCGNPITDPRDGKIYPTVQIGSQCWLASNLDYGTIIQDDIHQTDNCIAEKYHNPASSIQYPASVYQWDELMRYEDTPGNQGLCPPGWHVPTESDWTILFNSYTSNAFAGYPLTHSGFSGFIALLSGVQHMNETWDFNGFATFFWSSDKDGSTRAWSHGMNSEDPSVSSYSASRGNGFSVRCLKD